MIELAGYISSLDGGKLVAAICLLMYFDIRSTIKGMARSVESLNNRIGIVVERVDSHEKRIDKLEDKN